MGHDNAVYTPIDRRRKIDIDALVGEGFLWHPETGYLVGVWDCDPSDDAIADHPETVFRDSEGNAVDVWFGVSDKLFGEAVAEKAEDGSLAKETLAATGLEEAAWPDYFMAAGDVEEGPLSLNQVFRTLKDGWVGVSPMTPEPRWDPRSTTSVRDAIAAARHQSLLAEEELLRRAAEEEVGTDTRGEEAAATDLGDAFVPEEITLADLVGAYQRDAVSSYQSSLYDGSLTQEQYMNACAALDKALARQFGEDYEDGPRPGRPAKGEIGTCLAEVDKLVAANLDLKGHIVLARVDTERMGREALVYRGGDISPFVVAHGYNEQTGEWAQGSYCATLDRAVDELDRRNPDVCETVQIMRSMVEEALGDAGLATSERNVEDTVMQADLYTAMVEAAWDSVESAIQDIGDSLEPATEVAALADEAPVVNEEGLEGRCPDQGEVL